MITVKNLVTGKEIQCSGLWTNPVLCPRIIYAMDTMQGHTALDDEIVEFADDPSYIQDQHGEAWRRLKIVKPWRLIPN